MPLFSPPPVDVLCDESVSGDRGRLILKLALIFAARRPDAVDILLFTEPLLHLPIPVDY